MQTRTHGLTAPQPRSPGQLKTRDPDPSRIGPDPSPEIRRQLKLRATCTSARYEHTTRSDSHEGNTRNTERLSTRTWKRRHPRTARTGRTGNPLASIARRRWNIRALAIGGGTVGIAHARFFLTGRASRAF